MTEDLLFISDLHLSDKRPEITQAFYHFLQTTAKDYACLYILGDFFDSWIGDDDDSPYYQEVIQALSQHSQAGYRLFFMPGNRDFLVGNQFAAQTGLELLEDPTVISHQQTNYLLMHGDSLCTDDKDYMQFRKTTRNRAWQAQILAMPLSERRHYAKQLRQKSREMNSLKATDIMDVTPEAVIDIMTKHQVHTLIHGHTHRPDKHSFTLPRETNNATRWVLGDWEQYGWYLSIRNNTVELSSFSIEK